MVNEIYNLWINHPDIDLKLKEELLSMNQSQIEDAFFEKIAFGTAGMRGIIGAGTAKINIHTLTKANFGFAKYILKYNGSDRGIAIGYDNRHMSYEFAIESAKALASFGIRSYIFESLRPTPELSFAVRKLNCFGGIMITASHNPKEYNGYKLYDENGCQVVPHLAEEVVSYVNEIEDELALKYELNDEQKKLIQFIGSEIDEEYYKEVLNIQLRNDIKKIRIVFTPQHGTALKPVSEILKRAGYEVIIVEEQSQPDPDFTNTKTPNPEEIPSYDLAIKYAKKYDADIILSCDPDADRMGVAVKFGDSYKLLSGNQTGSILIDYILNQYQLKNNLPKNAVIFNTVVTSDLGEIIANQYGVEVEKTLTGFKFIGDKIAKYEKTKEKSFIFGYEESYGYLIKEFVRDKDAPQACLILAEASNYYKQENKTLYDVLISLYEKYGYFEESQVSLSLSGLEGAQKIKQIIYNLRTSNLRSIADVDIVKFEDFGKLKTTVNGVESDLKGFLSSEVLKFFLKDGSWIAVRPSGTEPKCKFYFCVKGHSLEEVQAKTKKYQEFMLSFT